MHRLTLAQANALIDAAVAEATRLGLKPLTFGVFDPGGNLIALQRQDGAPQIGPKVVTGKASGALALGVSSRTVGDLAMARPHVIGAVGELTPGGMVPAAGALLIQDGAGPIMGALAASGDTSDNDELCVLGAIEAVGLLALR
jgi:uncharacterized protein GlcG (DUF336 family)